MIYQLHNLPSLLSKYRFMNNIPSKTNTICYLLNRLKMNQYYNYKDLYSHLNKKAKFFNAESRSYSSKISYVEYLLLNKKNI